VSNIEFELIVGEAGGEIHNADIPVRWCVTPSLVKNMEDAGIVDPHVLILTATANGTEIQRQVVPITELMTYARYTKAGAMKLYGWIVDGKMGRKKLHERLTRAINGHFQTTLINWEGYAYHDVGDLSYAHAAMDIEIPEGVFGKEPSPWVKWFSNLWHENRSVDQCHFRRRKYLAFTLKWMPVSAFVIVSSGWRLIMATFMCLIGYHKWVANPKYIFRPFDAEFSDVFDISTETKNVFAFSRKTKYKTYGGNDVEQTLITVFAFIPFISLLTFSLCLITKNVSESLITTGYVMAAILACTLMMDIFVAIGIWFKHTSTISALRTWLLSGWEQFDGFMVKVNGWHILQWSFGLAILAVLAGFTIMFWEVALLIASIVIPFILVVVGSMWLMNRFMFGDLEGSDYTEIRELLCPKDEENKIASYSAIPKKQRSLRLWYLDTKNKVCKPMQL